MNTHLHVELLRLHGEHLRTLLDHFLTEVTTIGHALAADGSSSDAVVGAHMNELEKQREHIALEVVRLQGFVQALEAKSTNGKATAVASQQSPSPASDTREY